MRALLCALILVAVAACSVEEPPKKSLSKRERDSLIGESVLPGAGVVKAALAESDQQVNRAARMDSLYRSAGR